MLLNPTLLWTNDGENAALDKEPSPERAKACQLFHAYSHHEPGCCPAGC